MGPQLYKKVITDTLWVSGYPIDLESLMDDLEFKGITRMNIFTLGYAINLYVEFKMQIQELMEQIDNELKLRQC